MKRELDPICTFVIYDCPRDFPHHVVVRAWRPSADGGMAPLNEAATFDVAELGHRGAMVAARAHCRRLGLTFLPRSKADDPVIVEIWQGRPKRPEASDPELDARASLRAAVLG